MKTKSRENKIIKAISYVCNVDRKDIVRNEDARRTSQIVEARQIMSYLLWDEFDYTFFQIRDAIGYKNHASAIHSKKMHEIDYFQDKRYRKMYDEIVKKLNIKQKDDNILLTEKLELEDENKELRTLIKMYKEKLKNETRRKERYEQELISFKKKFLLNY